MSVGKFAAIVSAALLGASAISPSAFGADAFPGQVPENCHVYTDQFGNCMGVVCEESGMLVLYECSEFGL